MLLSRAFLSPENSNRQEPLPDSALINGRGSCLVDCAQPPPRFVTTVQPGRRHLLRIVNTSGMLPFTLSIDNHAMIILNGEHNEAHAKRADAPDALHCLVWLRQSQSFLTPMCNVRCGQWTACRTGR